MRVEARESRSRVFRRPDAASRLDEISSVAATLQPSPLRATVTIKCHARFSLRTIQSDTTDIR